MLMIQHVIYWMNKQVIFLKQIKTWTARPYWICTTVKLKLQQNPQIYTHRVYFIHFETLNEEFSSCVKVHGDWA